MRRSLGVCRGLGLVEEGLRPRYMHIGGQWADHIAFFIDAESLPAGSCSGVGAQRDRLTSSPARGLMRW